MNHSLLHFEQQNQIKNVFFCSNLKKKSLDGIESSAPVMSSPSPSSPPATDANATSPISPPAGDSTFPPPPPPPPNSTNSTVSSPPATSGPSSSPSSDLATGTLIGLVLGIGLGGLIVMIGVCIFVVCYRRRKRKRKRSRENNNGVVGGAPHGRKDDTNTGLPQNTPPPSDNKFLMLPKPTPPPGVTSNTIYPPPPSTNSSMSSDKPVPSISPGMSLGFSQSTFTYEELAVATDGFPNSNLIGQGGFGYVYKGVLPNGKVVAVKQLKAGSGQGEREFQAEVEIISRVHHRHLVKLVGYCIAGDQRMLVYEFVPNNTLEFHLHGKGRPPMNWPTRMKIALGSAKGLAYLHEDCQPKIIHRDIKAANILLDFNFEAKVADFGLAKLSLDTDTHVSTRVMGTFGYLAPEYASSGKLTDKSDVFSFGVVLLELLTGRRPIDKAHPFADDSMVEWARPLLSEALETGNFDELIDPRLQKNYNSVEIARVIASAAFCVRHSARRRPRMSEIVRALEGNLSLEHLNEGIIPGHSSVYTPSGSLDYDTSQYKEDMKKFRKMALESQELGSTECSGPTSEFSQLPSGSTSEGQQSTQDAESGKMKQDDTENLVKPLDN